MPRKVLKSWIVGILVGILLLFAGTFMNILGHTLPAPKCENKEFVKYVSCGPAGDSGNVYYLTGWPEKMYCYGDFKPVCTPWEDFLAVPRNSDQRNMYVRNEVYILLGSAIIGLVVVAISLTRQNLKHKSHAHTGH